MTRKTMRGWVAALLALAMASVLATPVAADSDDAPPPVEADTGRYVVVMTEVPNVTELGREGVTGSAAEARSVDLTDSHAAAAAAAGLRESAVSYHYTTSLNGFAAEMTDAQVERMRSTDGVLMVLKDQWRYAETDSSADFLGLSGRGEAHSTGVLGDGVIVGVIDSGIWPEHPSFADDGSYPDPGVELDESTRSACDFGNTEHNENDAPFECNNKLIGARQMLSTYRAVIGADPDEFDSGRDDDGHGTHTASTAAGNAGVEATILGTDVGRVTGVAPRAHIISYKGLGNLGGFGSDLAAAIDQAVLDGVDVINYSVGGGTSDTLGADDIAYLFAADAGVHVATSAGNSGPGPATIGGPAHVPWLTTVGASSQTRFFQGRVRAANGRSYTGASLTQDGPFAPLVDAEFAGGDLCLPGTLDPEVVEGNIVLCRRGAIARVGKSLAVSQAGGVGMILYNNDDAGDLVTDTHFVPSVHMDFTPGSAIKQYIATNRNPRARITTGEVVNINYAASMAPFSSRGPNPISADIIKPDVTAPGMQIVAGNSPFPDPGSVQGELFQSIQGTSMSSPHVAGLMALIAERHPDWSAAALKSAIMTTAHQDVRDNDRSTPAGVFEMGAGHIDPGKTNVDGTSFNPGLVYEADFFDYLGFICDAYPADVSSATCDLLDSIGVPTEAVNLNYPSIGIAELPGSKTITRTVTSVAPGGFKTYRVSVDAPEGYEVTVTPDNIRLKQGQSATYQVTITNVDAPIGEWREGSLTWKFNRFEVRSPIAVRGTKLATPAVVSGEGVDGEASIPVRFGYTGDYTAAAHGLEASTVFSGNVLQDPDQTFDPADVEAGGAVLYEVEASGDAALLISMPPEAVNDPAIDIDLFVYDPAGNQVAASTSGGTNESIILPLPDDGVWQIYVHGWQTAGPSADFDLYTWLISATPGGNMTIDSAPESAVVGVESSVDFSWTGANDGEWHLGAISHSDAEGLMSLTLVEVDNR
ncbi:MAG: S8 family serine peptidase [Acidimicrobiales bacterium]